MTDLPSVMIGVPVKESARWLPSFLRAIKEIDYPGEKLRIVFIYGQSKDNTLELLKDFKKEEQFNIEVYAEGHDNNLRIGGAQLAGSIYNDFQKLLNEDYFMLLDSDVIEVPKDILRKLLSYNEDIVAPFVWTKGNNLFYDSWIFRVDNKRFHPQFPPGSGLDLPFEVDSVGTCFLVRRDIFKTVPIGNPYPNLSFCSNARKNGFKVFADPTTHIFHADVAAEGFIHNPLPQNMGGYPDPEFVTGILEVIDINGERTVPLRAKFSTDKMIASAEILAYCIAMKNYALESSWKKKGKKWCYNYSKFQTFWKTGNKDLIKAMYRTEMYPVFIEVEVTTACNLKCRVCEHTYWNEPVRMMTLNEFKSIVDQFPNLVWIGLTGIGESFLNKDFLDMIAYVKQKDVFIEIYDSFYFLDEEMIRKLVDLGVDRIIASVDAATKETYEKIRIGSSYEKVWNNIIFLDKYKKKKKLGRFPELCFHYIITKENISEVIPYLKKLRELDLDVTFVQFGRMLHKFKEIKDMFIEVPEDVQKEILKVAEELKISISWNANLPKIKPPKEYCTEVFMPFIFVTGDIITCCAMNEQNDREWQKKISIGNIFEESFKDIWTNEKYRKVRNHLLNLPSFPDECRDCPVYEEK